MTDEEREDFTRKINTIRLYRALIADTVEKTGMPWDAVYSAAHGFTMHPKDVRINHQQVYSLAVTLDKWKATIGEVRASMLPDPVEETWKRAKKQSEKLGSAIYGSRFSKKSETPGVQRKDILRKRLAISALGAEQYDSMEARGMVPEDEWDTVTVSAFMVSFGFHLEATRMGLTDWINLGSKPNMYVCTIERRTPDWAEKEGIDVRKVITMRATKRKSSYGTVDDAFEYTNNVWMITHTDSYGNKHSSFGRTWQHAKALIDKSIRGRVFEAFAEAD